MTIKSKQIVTKYLGIWKLIRWTNPCFYYTLTNTGWFLWGLLKYNTKTKSNRDLNTSFGCMASVMRNSISTFITLKYKRRSNTKLSNRDEAEAPLHKLMKNTLHIFNAHLPLRILKRRTWECFHLQPNI